MTEVWVFCKLIATATKTNFVKNNAKKNSHQNQKKFDANMFDSAMDSGSCIVLMIEFLKIAAKAIVERSQLKTFDRVWSPWN